MGNQRGNDVFPGIQLSYADKGAAMSTSVTLKTIKSYKDKIDKEDKIKNSDIDFSVFYEIINGLKDASLDSCELPDSKNKSNNNDKTPTLIKVIIND